MRRRVWAFIRQGDIMISFQLGLPAMVDLSDADLNLPRNIHDDDNFDEDCAVLPPALPESVATEISFLLAKTRLAFGFARAAAEINRSPSIKWERILEIDRGLRHIYDTIPGAYKLGVLSQQDSLIISSAKFTLANIHHKSLCIIHSRFLELARSDHRYLYSRKVCLSSAMSILRIQAIQDQDIPVDGKIRSLTSYQTSLTIHDFLLAAAIISSDLCSCNTPEPSVHGRASASGIPSRADMVRALSVSAQIFGRMQDRSKEACKAADVLSMLVGKLEATTDGPRNDTYHATRPAHIEKARPRQRQNLSLTTKDTLHSSELPPAEIDFQPGETGSHSTWSGPRYWPVESTHSQADWLDEGVDAGLVGFTHVSDPYGAEEPHQWDHSIAMNDPLSTLWDLNADFSGNSL